MADDGVTALRAGLTAGASACEPGEPGYNEAVTIWNGAITKRPSLVVRCATDSDVAAALAFARGRGLEVSVRGGGHNYAGSSLTDGGVMIDLTPMKTVTVDARRATRDVRRRHHLGRAGRRDPGARAGRARRLHQPHRRRRADARRRDRLARPQGRTVVRQPGRRRRRHGRRPVLPAPSPPRTRTCSGRSAVAAATSASSPSSSSRCTRSARSSTSGCSSSGPATGATCSGSRASTCATCPRTAACSWPGSARHRPHSSHRNCTTHAGVRAARRRLRRRSRARRGHRADHGHPQPDRAAGDTDPVRRPAADVRRIRALGHPRLRESGVPRRTHRRRDRRHPRAPGQKDARRCRSSRSSSWAAAYETTGRRRDRPSAAPATSATSSTSPARLRYPRTSTPSGNGCATTGPHSSRTPPAPAATSTS